MEGDILERVKYPHLDTLERIYPEPDILLNNEIYWTTKEDGSNCGITLIDDIPQVRSRNLRNANSEMYARLISSNEWSKVIELLKAIPSDDQWVLFGELCQKGKSPTRLKTYPETKFVAFDLWSDKLQSFITYTELEDLCKKFKVLLVELISVTTSTDLKNLIETKDMIVDQCKELKEEGSVGKCFINGRALYFKAKWDIPTTRGSSDKDKIPRLPALDDVDIMSEVQKALDDLGETDFKDVKKAMPVIAKYVSKEARRNGKSGPRNLFYYYERKLKGLLLIE